MNALLRLRVFPAPSGAPTPSEWLKRASLPPHVHIGSRSKKESLYFGSDSLLGPGGMAARGKANPVVMATGMPRIVRFSARASIGLCGAAEQSFRQREVVIVYDPCDPETDDVDRHRDDASEQGRMQSGNGSRQSNDSDDQQPRLRRCG
jgi:hypothetical protein